MRLLLPTMGRPSGFLLRVGAILIKVSPGKKARRRRFADQMLKWEVVDLDFAEKCSNFVVATEQAAIGQGLLRFLVALQAQNYPGLGKN